MTPYELEKEAARISKKIKMDGRLRQGSPVQTIMEALRAVHDAAIKEDRSKRTADDLYRHTWNAAIEKAAEVVLDQDRVKAGNMMDLQVRAANEIRALKIGESR